MSLFDLRNELAHHHKSQPPTITDLSHPPSQISATHHHRSQPPTITDLSHSPSQISATHHHRSQPPCNSCPIKEHIYEGDLLGLISTHPVNISCNVCSNSNPGHLTHRDRHDYINHPLLFLSLLATQWIPFIDSLPRRQIIFDFNHSPGNLRVWREGMLQNGKDLRNKIYHIQIGRRKNK